MTLRDTAVKRFTNRLEALISHHNELKIAIHNKRNEATLENELVTQFVLQATVIWESFLNDLILAYIEMSPSKAISSIETRIKQSVENKFGKSSRRALTFSHPGKATRAVLVSLLDHRGWNISSRDATGLATKANNLLASRYAKKFSLDSEDSEFFDYVVCLRNFLSHYSSGARNELRKTTVALSQRINAPLKANIGQIGNYLKSDGGGRTSRAVFVVLRIRNIASKL